LKDMARLNRPNVQRSACTARSVVQRRGRPARHIGAIGAALGLTLCRSVLHQAAAPGEEVVIELDEMWHFLQRKDTKFWIWKAYDRATGRLIDWECGARDERTFRRLFERLARWKVRLFCSDNYVVYPLVLAVGGHYQDKGETVALKRNNRQQRHWIVALRRRSIVVSKSLAMPLAHLKDALPARQRRLAAAKGIERRVALFAHLHVNKDAAPEIYRLPIKSGEVLTFA
jgi:insertion element IS1 protein InsB